MRRSPPALKDLVGMPLWAVGRAADLEWFQFGARKKIASNLPSQRGRTREVGELALHVQSPWRLLAQGQVLVASYDINFPKGVCSFAEVPEDFDWNGSVTRLDEVIGHLSSEILPVKVVSIDERVAGGFAARFQRQLVLEVFPSSSVEAEYWRLFSPGDEDREHLVFESSSNDNALKVMRGLPPCSAYTSTFASVRFWEGDLNPAQVTTLLRLPPSHTHCKGEPRLVRRRADGSVRKYAPYRHGMWSMSSKGWVESDVLERHVRWLLDELESRRHEVAQLLVPGVERDIFCYSCGATPECPQLSEETRARAKALTIPIEFDHYDSTPSEDEEAVQHGH